MDGQGEGFVPVEVVVEGTLAGSVQRGRVIRAAAGVHHLLGEADDFFQILGIRQRHLLPLRDQRVQQFGQPVIQKLSRFGKERHHFLGDGFHSE